MSSITCESFDSHFFELFKNSNDNNNNKNVRLQNALFQSAQWVISSQNQQQTQLKELFSSRRASDWKEEHLNMMKNISNINNMKPIRVIGFVQELDTEASLIEVDPRHFVRGIVGQTSNYSHEDQNQQPLYAECLSAFITPIPGFCYTTTNNNNDEPEQCSTHYNDENNNTKFSSHRQNQEKQQSIQKRDRTGEENNITASQQNAGNVKRARVESNTKEEQESTANSKNEKPKVSLTAMKIISAKIQTSLTESCGRMFWACRLLQLINLLPQV
jgi:hypothetical protein